MAGINKVILIGNLGRDPELRYTQGDTAVATLSVATTRVYTNRNNERVEETEWHRVTLWGQHAENANRYLSKGRQVYIEGHLKTRKYEDKDGVTRYSTDIVGEIIQYLGSRGGNSEREDDPRESERQDSTRGGSGNRHGDESRQNRRQGSARGGGYGGEEPSGRSRKGELGSGSGFDNYIPDPSDDDIPF